MNKSKDVVQQGNNPIKHVNNEFTPIVHNIGQPPYRIVISLFQ
jgi:hypothetical protein